MQEVIISHFDFLTEAVARRCSAKYLFLEILQNSREKPETLHK